MSKALLLDVLQSPQDFGLREEDICGRRIDYTPPSGGRLVLPKSMTGWEEDQEFIVEEDMPFYPFLYEGRVILVSGRTASNGLTLEGKIGYEKGKECIKEICGLYASEKLGTEAAELTSDMYYKMPEFLQRMCYYHWLSSCFDAPRCNDDCSFEFAYACSEGVYGSATLYYKYANGSSYSIAFGRAVRPVFYFKPDVYIDIDKIKPMKLILS